MMKSTKLSQILVVSAVLLAISVAPLKAAAANTSTIAGKLRFAIEEITGKNDDNNENKPIFVNALPKAKDSDVKRRTVRVVSAYTSRPEETDDTPFITANGTRVADGIVAANWLPFNAKVRIPEYFGDKIFTVTDRMNRRFDDRLDIWMDDLGEARHFGVRKLTIEVLK